MFGKLIDVLLDSLKLFQFFTVVPVYAGGVILRFGKYNREATPGFRWLIPFRVEEAITTNVVPETMMVGPQSLTTSDGVSLVVTTVVTFSVVDVRVFLLEIEGAKQVIEDGTYGGVSRFIASKSWAELNSKELDLANEITKVVRRQAKKYGVDIITVQIGDFTRSRSFRVMQQYHNPAMTLTHI